MITALGATVGVFVATFIVVFLILSLDNKLYAVLCRHRLPLPYYDHGVSFQDNMERIRRYAKAVDEWQDSPEQRVAARPGGALWLYIRDHYVRRQPWTTTKSA